MRRRKGQRGRAPLPRTESEACLLVLRLTYGVSRHFHCTGLGASLHRRVLGPSPHRAARFAAPYWRLRAAPCFAAGCRHIHGASANRKHVGDSLADAATTTRDKGNSAVEISIVSIARHMISVQDRAENK